MNLLSDIEDIDISRLNGLRRVVVNLGLGFAVSIGGFLAHWGYGWIFFYSIIFQVTALLILSINYRLSRSTQLFTKEKMEKSSQLSGKSIGFLNIQYCTISIVYFLTCLVFFQLYTTYPIYLQQAYNINKLSYGFIFTFNAIMIVLIEVPLLTYLKRHSQAVIAAIGTLLIGMGFLILPFAQGIWGIYFSAFWWTLGEILFFSSLFNVIIAPIRFEDRGSATGVYQAVSACAKVMAPNLGIFLYQFYTGNFLWGFCGLVGLLSCMVLWQITKYRGYS